MPELTVAGTRHLPWEESTEREITLTGLELTALEKEPHRHPVDIPAGRDVEWLTDTSGARVGALVRTWQSIAGEVEVRAEPVQPGLARLTVVVANTTPWGGTNRDEALPRTMISTHVIATAAAGRFVSLLDPPPEFREAAEQFDQNLTSIVSQNTKIADYVRRLERKSGDDEDEPPTPAEASDPSEPSEVAEIKDELPPSGDLVAEIEQFLRQQRPKDS